jgi:glucokinase
MPVFIDNDANLGALSEARHGREISDFIYITHKGGIGCGIIRNHQLYRGANGIAGELGHIVVDKSGPLCTCEKYGCLESLAGGTAIINDALQKKTSLTKFYPGSQKNTGTILDHYEDIDLNDVIHAANSRDLASQAALRIAGKRIGSAIATIITILNPHAVILEGPVMQRSQLLFDAAFTPGIPITEHSA